MSKPIGALTACPALRILWSALAIGLIVNDTRRVAPRPQAVCPIGWLEGHWRLLGRRKARTHSDDALPVWLQRASNSARSSALYGTTM